MRCDEQLKNQIAQHLSGFDHQVVEQGDLRRAAVALTITDVGPGADVAGIADDEQWSDQAALVLTRRSSQLRHHPGQWALPGGRVDEGETLIQTALREMREEVGLVLGEQHVLGVLDDFVTRSGFIMTPVVVWGGPNLTTQANEAEVASVHRIPVQEFLRPDAPKLDKTDTSEHPILRMPIGDDHIAAPTAALLYQFAQVCLRGHTVRVAHFEQPEFAWR